LISITYKILRVWPVKTTYTIVVIIKITRGRRGRDHIVGFTTTYTISAYHH